MDLIQARSIQTRLRGYPGRALEKAQDYKEAAQARVAAEVVVDPAREAAQDQVVEEAVAVPDLEAAQDRVVADAAVVPDQAAMVATDNNLDQESNRLKTKEVYK